MPLPRRLPQQRYSTVATTYAEDEPSATSNRHAGSHNSNNNNNTVNELELAVASTTHDEVETKEDGDNTLQVTILDFCHTRFTVVVDKNDTVLQLKEKGSQVHNVPASQQRLIYQGKLLQDDAALKQCNIVQNGVIVHLFPKPRVVVVNSSDESTATASLQQQQQQQLGLTNENESSSGARVPTIVLDQHEAERRGQILVLSSMDYIEAVNNVKLFSFMLLIVSTIELLNLLAIAMGQEPQENAGMNPSNSHSESFPYTPEDDFFSDDDGQFNNNNNNSSAIHNRTSSFGDSVDPALAIYETWSNLSYLDLVVSALGFYVALLGIQASNENALRTAKMYLWGTCLTAAGWLAYNYLIALKADEATASEQRTDDGEQGNTDDGNDDDGDSVYDQAFQVMVLPGLVWAICIFRAFQFQHLLAEAELEAAERIAAEQRPFENSDEEQPPAVASAVPA